MSSPEWGITRGIWANARTAVPAVWVFTFLTFTVTLVHFDRFHFLAPRFITVFGTWFWLLVYVYGPGHLDYLSFLFSSRGLWRLVYQAHGYDDCGTKLVN